MSRKPKIYHQAEKSYHCGACVTATVLDWFGEEPDPILKLYKDLRGEENSSETEGLYKSSLQSYFLRKDWICLSNTSGGPAELHHDKSRLASHHEKPHQRIATWRIINQMLKDGYLCILEYRTAAGTYHFAVVYDAFLRRNIHWLKIACSGQGYMEVQVESFFDNTGTSHLFIKPCNNEYR